MNDNQKGLLITLEGGEGAGKTTILEHMMGFLQSSGREVMTTREPGGVRIAEQLREIILNPENTSIDGKTEMLLFAAARRIHLLEKVVPALEAGQIVVVDRFIDSSMAYQGYAHGGKLQDIEWLNNYATDGLKPDLTLYFDIDPEIGLTRVHTGSGREINRLDLEKQDFHEKVRAGYQAVAQATPDRIVTLDASQTIEHVTDQAITAITTKFPGVFTA